MAEESNGPKKAKGNPLTLLELQTFPRTCLRKCFNIWDSDLSSEHSLP